MTKFIQVQTTMYDKKEAFKIARELVEEKLAGCVQVIGQMDSFYTWKGKLVKDTEYLLIIKTKESLYKRVEEKIKKMHSYNVPEILSFTINEGNKDYLKWLEGVTDEKV